MSQSFQRSVTPLHKPFNPHPTHPPNPQQEQLGYSVSCGLRMTNGVLGLAVRVQSERYAPEHCQARMEAFLGKFAERLRGMPAKEYYRWVGGWGYCVLFCFVLFLGGKAGRVIGVLLCVRTLVCVFPCHIHPTPSVLPPQPPPPTHTLPHQQQQQQ
jgi:hypothetical protein